MKRLSFFLATPLVVTLCSSAVAGLVPIGDPQNGSSWGQGFLYTGQTGDPIDLIVVTLTLVEGGPLADPAIRAFDMVGWTVDQNTDAGMAWATGPASDQIGFEIWFHPPVDFSPVTLQFAAYAVGFQQAEPSFFAIYDGSTWDVQSSNWDITRDNVGLGASIPTTNPVPGSVLLGMLGLGLVMGRRQA